jgi:YbbR domain-containing protein
MISSVKRFLDTGNAVRFLLSFVCAFALWAWVTAERDPEQTYRASQIPVSVENTPAGLELVGLPRSVDLTLEGPRSVIQTIDAGSIRAYIDLDTISEPGTYERRVRIDAPPGIRRTTVQPDVVTVEVDTVASQSFSIEVIQPADIPRSLGITSTVVSPTEVEVTGVRQNVDRVARVILPIELRGQTESFTTEARPLAVDVNSVEVPSVEVRPNRVRVSVALEVRGKEIPVFVRCECTALDGYEVIGQPVASPPTILVDGPRDALAQVQYIYTTPIDTSGLSEPSLLSDVPLDTTSLPEGVTAERLLVDVSVRVEQSLFRQVFEDLPVAILGLSPDLEATVSPDVVSVEIEGPREDIAALTPNDVAVVVDITELDEGTHQLRPRVILPPRTRYSEPPPQVIVVITRIPPTPTPTAQPTPTSVTVPTPTPTTVPTPES